MIDIAIVEDNREQAAALESHIKTYAADHKLSVSVSIFYEPITFLEKYSPFHIVYMDIMMPMLNGMDAARLLREKDEKVILIFVTTMRQYAIQGYEVAASDFIVKPVAQRKQGIYRKLVHRYIFISQHLIQPCAHMICSKHISLILAGYDTVCFVLQIFKKTVYVRGLIQK